MHVVTIWLRNHGSPIELFFTAEANAGAILKLMAEADYSTVIRGTDDTGRMARFMAGDMLLVQTVDIARDFDRQVAMARMQMAAQQRVSQAQGAMILPARAN